MLKNAVAEQFWGSSPGCSAPSLVNMASLFAAHRGYEYQDLLVACRLVDLLLGSILEARVDEKLVEGDRFDDLSTVDETGLRERTQFKHAEDANRPLAVSTFTTDRRGLRLDRLIAAILSDRSGPGRHASALRYRIVAKDAPPDESELLGVLSSIEQADPGPFIPGIGTSRFRFEAQALWPTVGSQSKRAIKRRPGLLLSGGPSLSLEDLEWVCQRLVLELNAPPASGDLTSPDAAERLLLSRVTTEVGAAVFPNLDRSAVDVAAAMISTARAARQGRLSVTPEAILRRAQLRSDFGAVSRAHPVDRELEVLRPLAVRQIVEAATEASTTGGHLIIVGPPGQGKSWVCHQVVNELSTRGWLTAEHYCFLGDVDGERNERVLSERVFGSLVGRLASADPTLVVDHRPRFAADEEALEACLRRAVAKEPQRRIALLIDGIDHITRVRSRAADQFDPSRGLAEALAALELPPGVVAIVLSQPGAHLQALQGVGGVEVPVPGLVRGELELLAERLNIVPNNFTRGAGGPPLLEDSDSIARFIDALEERSGGNALYATYLCRETRRRADTVVDPAAAVRALPQFDGTLRSYYDHLYRALGAEAGWVADVVALVSFALTRAELRQIRPDGAHRVDAALAVLAPVLIERATQGGVRVYHESFARYLRGKFDSDNEALKALLDHIAEWLVARGFFADPRAFRSLLSILAEAGDHRRVANLVDRAFVTRAVAAGFPSSAIVANLAIAVGSAGRLGDWPTAIRCVELARAADSYQSERLDSTLVAFADVPVKLLGADTLASRLLLDDDRLAMPARAGLQICAALDAFGATAPWRVYMEGHLREAKSDNTSYGEESDLAVALAWMRGRLRLAAPTSNLATDAAPLDPGTSTNSPTAHAGRSPREGAEESEEASAFTDPVDWSRAAAFVQSARLPMREVVAAVADIHGLHGICRLIRFLDDPGEACLAYAERLASEPASVETHDVSPRTWAIAAAGHGVPAGSAHRLLRLGLRPRHLAQAPSETGSQLLDLTRRVQQASVRYQDADVAAWLDACALASHLDPQALRTAELLIVGEGWYRCWLRFAIALSRAEASGMERGALAFDGLKLLTEDVRPFAGDPRACDLYGLHRWIQDTISRGTRMLDDAQWEAGLGLLKEVSAGVSTTLFGELGGPVPPDFPLRLAVEGATPTRHAVAEKLIADQIAKGSGRRYYSDLAEYRLFGARLSLAAGQREAAEALWREACELLTAYGFHKDITVYELLDPLPALIKADPARGRVRVAAVQGLCERVPLHTDRKGTRGAWSRWWELLAKSDPVAAVHLAARGLMQDCNNPNSLLSGALEDVWDEWHEQVDPVLTGALRLSLDKTLDRRDSTQLQRLAASSGAEGHRARRLMKWLLARADERPLVYSYSNSPELLAQDDVVVGHLNEVANSHHLPMVSPIGVSTPPTGGRSKLTQVPSTPTRSRRSVAGILSEAPLPIGLPGLSRAIRLWRQTSYEARSDEWAVDRFANAIGYRLMSLVAASRHEDAASAIRALAASLGFDGNSSILRALAEGLERHGEPKLAALAYSLAWTRARGHGGWLSFGGETQLDCLARASLLDSEMASAIVIEEIARGVATLSGPYGISQAVIHALVGGALHSAGLSAAEAAFAVWDEAQAIIAARAPRVAASDDPDQPYSPPTPDAGELAPGDLRSAFALAALGGLADASRESKRRAFLATQLLLHERPETAADAVNVALSSISDPATLTWLLRLIDLSRDDCAAVLAACQSALRKLVSSDLLTVRALARRLLTGDEPPLVAASSPDLQLMANHSIEIWMPATSRRADAEERGGPDAFLEAVAGNRLRRGEQQLPGIHAAVRGRLASLVKDEQVRRRLGSQLDALADQVRRLWPDAFLVHEEAAEQAVQSVAAGGRAAMLRAGRLVLNGVAWEDALASALLDDPSIPLVLEATREPRPPLPPPPGKGHEVWAEIRDLAAGASNLSLEAAAEEGGLFLATLTIKPYSWAPVVANGRSQWWRWLATIEERSVKVADRREDAELFARRYRVMEVRDAQDRQALTRPPLAQGDLRMWKASVAPGFSTSFFDECQPLVAIDRELEFVGDGHRGLGAPTGVAVPTAPLLASLALRPSERCTYADDNGVGLALVTWRAEYETSEYYLAWPRIRGSGIVIRPDLLDRLVETVGQDRVVLRDFVVGDTGLAG